MLETHIRRYRHGAANGNGGELNTITFKVKATLFRQKAKVHIKIRTWILWVIRTVGGVGGGRRIV